MLFYSFSFPPSPKPRSQKIYFPEKVCEAGAVMRFVGLSRGLLGPTTTRGRPLSPASAPLRAARTPVSAVSQASMSSSITYLSQDQAQAIDLDLMGPLGFSVDQLMELAGLSVASSLAEVYSRADHSGGVLVFAGPGNNGGDGLVAARHLHHFGYRVKARDSLLLQPSPRSLPSLSSRSDTPLSPPLSPHRSATRSERTGSFTETW